MATEIDKLIADEGPRRAVHELFAWLTEFEARLLIEATTRNNPSADRVVGSLLRDAIDRRSKNAR